MFQKWSLKQAILQPLKGHCTDNTMEKVANSYSSYITSQNSINWPIKSHWIVIIIFCTLTHFCQRTHSFMKVIITETFKSVDLDVIVSLFDELRNHVLYWYMSSNDPVLYWRQLELPSSGRISTWLKKVHLISVTVQSVF